MKTHSDIPCDREQISALADGHLQGREFSAALQGMASGEARECWHVYQLIGDVLRSPELAACGRDAAFVDRLSQRLRSEAAPAPLPLPQPVRADVARAAANDGVFRWKMVAGLASFAAVAAVGWSVLGGIGPQPAGPQLAQGAAPAGGGAQVVSLAAPVPAVAASAQHEAPPPVMLRDPRLDELLAAHRQAAGVSALGSASGFLRNATFEGPAR